MCSSAVAHKTGWGISGLEKSCDNVQSLTVVGASEENGVWSEVGLTYECKVVILFSCLFIYNGDIIPDSAVRTGMQYKQI